MLRTHVGAVGNHGPFEAKFQRAKVLAVGEMKLAARVIQIIGIVRAVLLDRSLDRRASLAIFGRRVKWNIQPTHTPQWQAIKRNLDTATHADILAKIPRTE